MPSVQLQRFENILARMIARVVARAGLTDMNDSSVVKHILGAAAREIDDANFQLTRLQDLFSIDRAAGEDLDQRARDIQPSALTRIQSQSAVGFLVFSRGTNTGTTISIPVGTVAKTTDGISVRTTQLGVITNTSPEQITGHSSGRDSNLVAAIAIEPGEAGNIASNTAVKFGSKPPGIDAVTNVSAFVQGRDKESDDEFRARLKNYITSLARSTPDALKFAALGTTDAASGKQVVFAHVYEDPINRGNVTLYIDDGAGTVEATAVAAPDGTGDSISAPVSNIQTLTDDAELFRAEFVGRDIVIAGAANGANNGTFPITGVNGSNQILYTNAAGVVEASFGGTWAISDELVTEGLVGPPTNAAVGGEEFLFIDNAPVRTESTVTITSSTRGVLTEGTDYALNPASGLIFFITPLAAAEEITANYTYFTGLIDQVQKIIDGDPDDRLNFPGYRAAGVLVRVRAPTVVPITVAGFLTIGRGYDAVTVRTNVETAVSRYINQLGISGDVIRNEIIERVMAVPGVVDVTLTLPTSNTTILDNEIPRIADADIDIV